MTTIKVLGTGCKKCVAMKANVDAAVAGLGIEADVQKVESINDIVACGVMSTPALVIDDEVKVVGRVPSADEVAKLLQAQAAAGTKA